jgi:hypothetical protein
VPPILINEEQVFSFKFWFDGNIHYGMFYQNELFFRLASFKPKQRPQVYQLGCKLARQNTLIALSCSETGCTLWGSLRSPLVKHILLNASLPELPAQNCF